MTPPHPEATGSYGAEAIEWIERELKITLRWWQRLAIIRQLERRDDGTLCWRVILESAPRRAGKSVRLRGMALWRLAHADLFGEKQLCLHTGKDVAIVREIHRQAWAWATEQEGWLVRKGVGQEEVVNGENRWLVRSLDSTYGYDLTYPCVDEGWAVPPNVVDEALEPGMLERQSPQLLITSTAHRRATSLLRKRLASALAEDDGETLLLLWAAPPGADQSDPETWRLASPHWSEDRRKMIASKYQKALAGEADPELDDSDPIAGWSSQYLNVWRLSERRETPGNALCTPETWQALSAAVPRTVPTAVAIESWEGVSVAYAYNTGSTTLVRTEAHTDLTSAANAVRLSGYRGTTVVGASLATDPALSGLRLRSATLRTPAAAQELQRLLNEDALRHDGSEHLTEQVLAIRTQPAPDGMRVVSKGRADALKAAIHAVNAARKPSLGGIRLITGN